ncbi:hypothetical protein ACH5RR_000914 [Cinchona calisaya]|uniref:Cytochrome P450 n=1 Tax=Cinchona calisaya TaxID=153742 RepID=A0ABD3B231_9GENT
MINQRLNAMKAGEPAGNDLLGVLLRVKLPRDSERRKQENVGLAIDEIIDEGKLFYFCGQHTTGVTLAGLALLLCSILNGKSEPEKFCKPLARTCQPKIN